MCWNHRVRTTLKSCDIVEAYFCNVTTGEWILMSIYTAELIFRTRLMKAYMAETSCNQFLLSDWFCYVHAHQDLFTIKVLCCSSMHALTCMLEWKRLGPTYILGVETILFFSEVLSFIGTLSGWCLLHYHTPTNIWDIWRSTPVVKNATLGQSSPVVRKYVLVVCVPV